jgi:hypothetical protein
MKHLLLLLTLVAATLPSCASWKQNRWLDAHHENLKRIAASNISAEAKLDALAADYVQFMKEDLKFVDPVKGVKYVKRYHAQNDKLMQQILQEANVWQNKLSTLDKIALGLRTTKKPWIKDFIDLTPKFQRKYKQYAFALKLAGDLGKGVFGFAGKALF